MMAIDAQAETCPESSLGIPMPGNGACCDTRFRDDRYVLDPCSRRVCDLVALAFEDAGHRPASSRGDRGLAATMSCKPRRMLSRTVSLTRPNVLTAIDCDSV